MNPLLLCALLLTACPKKANLDSLQAGPTMVPSSNVYLRNSFDTDPSVYLGRFVPEDQGGAVDETSAMQLGCSRLITYRKVGGGNAMVDELFYASAAAAARVGVPILASTSAGGKSESIVRVKYTQTGKMVAEASDPVAFEACCKQAPDQCTSRYIGEFLEGTGNVYFATGRAAEGDAGATKGTLAGSVEVAYGMEWTRSITFTEPVYFGMKVTESRWSKTAVVARAGCGDWTLQPPKSSQGLYFVGRSDPQDTERLAREMALVEARAQVVKWVGQEIQTGGLRSETTAGQLQALASNLQEERFVEVASNGVASLVKDENWCIENEETPDGLKYIASVLAFLPNEAKDQARATVLGTSTP